MFEAQFQTFDDTSERAQSAARVTSLRAELERRRLDGFMVPRADRQQNEYLPASEERLAWLTGFTGSAGAAIVLADSAALFVDGRYTVQADAQVDRRFFPSSIWWTVRREQWLEQKLKSGGKLGYDPWLHTTENAEQLKKACAKAGAELIAVDDNPIDALWPDRPAPPAGHVVLRDIKFAGESATDKLKRIRAELAKLRADVLVVSDPQNVAWAFNIRGADVPHTPLALAFALVPREGRPALYVEGGKLDNEARQRWRSSPIYARRTRLSAIWPRSRARPCGSTRQRRRRAHAPGDGAWRQAGARRRSDRADEGGQEPCRDRRQPRRPQARRRGDDAVSGLVRARGAERQADRNRRGQGAGKLSPRHRVAQGHLVPDHRRRRAEWRNRALPRHRKATGASA